MTTTTGTASSRPVASAYTYDHAGRLTTVKHKLNSQAEVTLVSNTYDELGRLKSQAPHGSAANKLAYSYNIRGWLTGISGGKFTQSLYYNTGTGTPQYGGNVSSMTWKAGNETVTRGYRFAYDGLNRLASATYGEGANISSNANRFTEKVTAYDAQGNILALQRYGQTGASSYGLLDNLTYTLDGNRVTRVDDASTATAYNNGFAFKDAVKQADEYAYDKNGNLTQDLNKNILQIEYNALNLPCKVTFGNDNTVSYLYSAGGMKLRTVHKTGNTTATTDYVGNVVYENNSPKLLLTDAGYVSLSDGKYHYYLKDHQGNNRVVINQSGTVEEVNHYYPFGGVFASSGNVQPYKYNGKELDRKNGLEWYDYGARHYDAALGRFLTRDPLAEGYFSTSPYAYCLNNPIFYIDPLGTDTVPVNEVDWSEFKTQEDVIALDEVSVMEHYPWQTFENNGVYVRRNLLTGAYGGIVGERGLKNADSWLFFPMMLGRKILTAGFSPIKNAITSSLTNDALSKEAIRKGVDLVLRDPNKMRHIFGQSKHNFAPLASKLGGNEKVVQKALQTLGKSGKLPSTGAFIETVHIEGFNITIRGFMQDGIPRIGTMFIP